MFGLKRVVMSFKKSSSIPLSVTSVFGKEASYSLMNQSILVVFMQRASAGALLQHFSF